MDPPGEDTMSSTVFIVTDSGNGGVYVTGDFGAEFPELLELAGELIREGRSEGYPSGLMAGHLIAGAMKLDPTAEITVRPVRSVSGHTLVVDLILDQVAESHGYNDEARRELWRNVTEVR
jgi:hypothetical protein